MLNSRASSLHARRLTLACEHSRRERSWTLSPRLLTDVETPARRVRGLQRSDSQDPDADLACLGHRLNRSVPKKSASAMCAVLDASD